MQRVITTTMHVIVISSVVMKFRSIVVRTMKVKVEKTSLMRTEFCKMDDGR